MVIVRRATLADKEAIFTFVKKAYEGRWQYKIPERWQWEYVDNPFRDGDELPVWIAVDEDGNVVGQTCALVEPLKIGDEMRRVGWSVDTFLLPEYRGQGIGFQLQKANDEGNEIFMSLSMSKANRRIKAGLGSVPVDAVPLYLRMMRFEPDSLVEAMVKRLGGPEKTAARLAGSLLHWTFLDRLASAVLNARYRIQEEKKLPQADPSVYIEPVEVFGAEVDALWECLCPHYHAIVRRDAVYLNWKFGQQPHVRYLKFLAKKQDEVTGYIIVRKSQPPERNIGIIADLFAAPKDDATVRSLLAYALRYFQQEKVKDVEAASSLPQFQAWFESFGFRKIGEATPMFHCQVVSPACQEATEPGRWFFSKGDHDWDQFPLAR